MVLPPATVRTHRSGLPDRVGVPPVPCVPFALGAPIRWCGPARRLAERTQTACVPGLPGNIPAGDGVPGVAVFNGGFGGAGYRERCPPAEMH